MKFITSTNLKQWADTKDCEQTLPELIKKLIVASTASCDKLTFPSGDATCLSGWDGMVSCEGNIDLVPSGVSLWECGSDKKIKAKIDSDFSKRVENSLGHEKNNSTFVFVTPRIWKEADSWIESHKEEWNKIVIYTAVELENWIDKNPSVGMWLAEKLNILPSRGYKLPKTYWNEWAQGKDYILPFEIVLSGREEISKQIVNTCKNTGSIIIESLTQSEGIAFAIASISTCEDSEMLKDRMIVVTEKWAFDDLTQHYNNLILITTLTDNILYATKRGHSIIVASTPAEQLSEAIHLPIIEKNGFVASLVKIGIDEAKAKKIALDTAREINVFRRRCGIVIDQPKWVASMTDLLPAMLVGKWMDNVEGDRAVLETLSKMEYNQYESKLYNLLLEEETPLIHIGNMWRIRSPYEAINCLQNRITPIILNEFRTICQNIIQDDAPDALNEFGTETFIFKQCKQKYSTTLKEGVWQNLCLLSIIDNSDHEGLRRWVDETMSTILKDWDLSRFLSNKHFLTLLAEASPNCFLDFIEHFPIKAFNKVFTPIKTDFSLSGWKIFYTEILFALEMLAWESEYLNRVTALLFRFSEYKNDSNYVNKPENSLYNIYRFFLPQTHVSFKDRIRILSTYSSDYKNTIYKICIKNCKSLNKRNVLEPNQYFRWRLYGELVSTKYVNSIDVEQIQETVSMMLDCCDYSQNSISELISLSFDFSMNHFRPQIIDSIRKNLVKLNDTKFVADSLRKDINFHLRHPDSNWSLNETELKSYQDLLSEIEPKDLLSKSAWLFEYSYIELPGIEQNEFNEKLNKLQLKRTSVIQDIINSQGLDGIWEFIKIVKCPECLANGLVSIYDEQIIGDVLSKFKANEISESFAKSYLFELCRKDVVKYVSLAKHIIESDSEMTIVLYAPNYVEKLAKIASDCGNEIKHQYWESVFSGFIEGDVNVVVHELINVNRYFDAIELVCNARNSVQMSDLEIANLIYSVITKNGQNWNQMDMYYIETLLKDLDKSEDPEVIQVIVQIEFLLFRILDTEYDTSNMRFKKELSQNPELLFQLIELTYNPDDEFNKQPADITNESNTALRKHALEILLYSKNLVSFIDANGHFNEIMMNQYIDRLYVLAEQRKRKKSIEYVVGDILGDIPRDSNYPQPALCELIERLNSDIVDRHIRIRIFNSRGISSRSYNEGGNQERNIVSKLKGYKEKTKMLYPRITKIFDDLIKEYMFDAKNIDNEAFIMDLEY